MTIAAIYSRLSLSFFCLLSVTTIANGVPFFQHHTANAIPAAKAITTKQRASLRESLVIYHYQNNGNTETRQAIGRDTFSDASLASHSTPVSTSQTIDLFSGHQLTTQLANAPPVRYAFDALGRQLRVSTKGQTLKTTHYALQAGQAILTMTNALTGYTIKKMTNSLGQTIASCDNTSNRCTTVVYNDLGQAYSSTDATGITAQTAFNAQGKVLHRLQTGQDNNQHTVTLQNQYLTYDNVANTVKRYEQASDGHKTAVQTKTFDDNQHVIKTQVSGEASSLSTATPDNFGQVITATNSRDVANAPVLANYQHNALGELVLATIGLAHNNPTTLAATSDPDDQPMTVSMTHDLMGKLISKTLHPDGKKSLRRYRLTFNQSGQLIKKTLLGYHGTQAIHHKDFHYDNKGNQVSESDWHGNPLYARRFSDILGSQKLVCTQVVGANSIWREYTKIGKLHKIYNSTVACPAAGQPLTPPAISTHSDEIDYSYWSAANNPIYARKNYLREKIYLLSDGTKKIIRYDSYKTSINKPTQITDVAGNVTHYTYQYGRLTKATMTINPTNANTPARKLEIDYTYGDYSDSNFGLLTHVTRKEAMGTQGFRIIDVTVYHHDDHKRTSEILRYSPKEFGAYHDIKLRYSGGKLKTKIVSDPNFQSYQETYDYSVRGHLTRVIQQDLTGQSPEAYYTTIYTYDANSNLTSRRFQSPLALRRGNHRPALQTMHYTHNAFDQLLTVNHHGVAPYDDNGNLLRNDVGERFAYDKQSHLVGYHNANGEYNASFDYYADGSRKSWCYTDTRENATPVHQLQFFTQGNQDCNEIDEQGNQASYFFANGKREARITRIDGKINVTFYGQDNKNSVISKLSIDRENKPLQSMRYDAYGNVLAEKNTGGAVMHSAATITYDGFGYDGEYRDPKQAGGEIYLRARYYDPRLGAFLQRDSYTFMNEYGFVHGDPVGYSDPSGHISVASWLSVIPGYVSQGAALALNWINEPKHRTELVITGGIFVAVCFFTLCAGDFLYPTPSVVKRSEGMADEMRGSEGVVSPQRGGEVTRLPASSSSSTGIANSEVRTSGTPKSPPITSENPELLELSKNPELSELSKDEIETMKSHFDNLSNEQLGNAKSLSLQFYSLIKKDSETTDKEFDAIISDKEILMEYVSKIRQTLGLTDNQVINGSHLALFRILVR